MQVWNYARSLLLANIALIATFIFLPVFLFTDDIRVYQEFIQYLSNK